MRKYIKGVIIALPGVLAVLERWGGRIMDLIGFPEAAKQIETWRLEYVPDIGGGTYFLIAFSVIGVLLVHFWPSKYTIAPKVSFDPQAFIETVAFGEIITIRAKHLFGLIGATKHALIYSWSSGASGVFDSIEGHGFAIYEHDFDGDGSNEIIVRYHCGAHTHAMRIYKITEPPSGPVLIPGAEIGSDFPEITWEERKNGHGVIVYARCRNWSEFENSNDAQVDRYIFEKNKCVRLPDDQIMEN